MIEGVNYDYVHDFFKDRLRNGVGEELCTWVPFVICMRSSAASNLEAIQMISVNFITSNFSPLKNESVEIAPKDEINTASS